jgi:hypothetical protein
MEWKVRMSTTFTQNDVYKLRHIRSYLGEVAWIEDVADRVTAAIGKSDGDRLRDIRNNLGYADWIDQLADRVEAYQSSADAVAALSAAFEALKEEKKLEESNNEF